MPARRGLSDKVATLAVVLAICAVPHDAVAQQKVLTFLAGGAAGLALHESGHVLVDLMVGVSPGLKRVTYGPLPFFAITHEPVSPVREFAISSAGFWVQEGGNEILLTRTPRLREEDAPFRKGILAFNVLVSVGYAATAFAESGPVERDTLGMATAAGVSERAIGAVILTPAILDGWRYYKPDEPWIKWASRAAKIGGALLIFKAR